MELLSLTLSLVGVVGVVATFHYSRRKKKINEKIDDIKLDINKITNYSQDDNKELIRDCFILLFFCAFLILVPFGLNIFIPTFIDTNLIEPYYGKGISILKSIGILGSAILCFHQYSILRLSKKPKHSIKQKNLKLRLLKRNEKTFDLPIR